ncbi:hypothetical protein BOVMAS25_05040 [Streptococcus uberis]
MIKIRTKRKNYPGKLTKNKRCCKISLGRVSFYLAMSLLEIIGRSFNYCFDVILEHINVF